jgi:hypothetical protein
LLPGGDRNLGSLLTSINTQKGGLPSYCWLEVGVSSSIRSPLILHGWSCHHLTVMKALTLHSASSDTTTVNRVIDEWEWLPVVSTVLCRGQVRGGLITRAGRDGIPSLLCLLRHHPWRSVGRHLITTWWEC